MSILVLIGIYSRFQTNYAKIKNILPKEKPLKTVGRPIVSYRRLIDGIIYILIMDADGKSYPKNMDQVLLVIIGFRSGIALTYSKMDG